VTLEPATILSSEPDRERQSIWTVRVYKLDTDMCPIFFGAREGRRKTGCDFVTV